MKRSAGSWTVFAILILTMSILGLAGAVLYANDLVSKTAEKYTVPDDSCPSPITDFSKKERKTMTTAVHKEMTPLIDRAAHAKTETATFGLG